MQVEGQPTPREPLSKRIVLARLAPGARLGGYVVEEVIGVGGMGQVYRALDERLSRHVALKILPPDDADDEARARFLREARALARVEHNNVVRVFASGEDAGTAWMALEIIDGEPLSDLAGGGALDEETAVALCAQVARGLAAVHAVGVVHRDVKPENLLVDQDATVKIVDFGVAALTDGLGGGGFTTRAGVIVGTPHFMSPEQARGAVVDARSDAWSLGATLYALLTGRPPFYGSDSEADVDILSRVVRDPIPDIRVAAPSTSTATQALLARLFAREPQARPSDLGAVADELNGIAAALARGDASTTPETPAETTASTTATSSQESQESSSSPPRAGSVAGVVVLIAAAVAVGVLAGQRLAPPQIEERIVTQRVEVPVVVEVPAPATPPATSPSTTTPSTTAPSAPPTPLMKGGAIDVDAETARVRAAAADEQERSVDALLARDSAEAKDVLARLAAGESAVGDVVLDRVVDNQRGDLVVVAGAALFSPQVMRAKKAISFLEQRRDDNALMLLARAATSHDSPAVRRAAATARDSIFKVED